MKLYATVTSERDSRTVRKGGNDFVSVDLTVGNRKVGVLTLWEERMQVLTFQPKGRDEKGNPLVKEAYSMTF